eukprot:TRINITY_DN6696_c0_g1_i1.p1 TRINITY_DN6696_c0_g1~~TRINITY_DN6696_c0_g1_i1.p1  ORF type:complete len:398 (+),score=43.63 TRINITY_DN6696_c0_g1_i1:61-1254(+)
MTTSFADLPLELIEHCLYFVEHASDLFAIYRTCRAVRDVVQQLGFWATLCNRQHITDLRGRSPREVYLLRSQSGTLWELNGQDVLRCPYPNIVTVFRHRGQCLMTDYRGRVLVTEQHKTMIWLCQLRCLDSRCHRISLHQTGGVCVRKPDNVYKTTEGQIVVWVYNRYKAVTKTASHFVDNYVDVQVTGGIWPSSFLLLNARGEIWRCNKSRPKHRERVYTDTLRFSRIWVGHGSFAEFTALQDDNSHLYISFAAVSKRVPLPSSSAFGPVTEVLCFERFAFILTRSGALFECALDPVVNHRHSDVPSSCVAAVVPLRAVPIRRLRIAHTGWKPLLVAVTRAGEVLCTDNGVEWKLVMESRQLYGGVAGMGVQQQVSWKGMPRGRVLDVAYPWVVIA